MYVQELTRTKSVSIETQQYTDLSDRWCYSHHNLYLAGNISETECPIEERHGCLYQAIGPSVIIFRLNQELTTAGQKQTGFYPQLESTNQEDKSKSIGYVPQLDALRQHFGLVTPRTSGSIGRLVGPISQPCGTIDTASLTLYHTRALVCVF